MLSLRIVVAAGAALFLTACGSQSDLRTAARTTPAPRAAEPGFSATTTGQGCGAIVRWIGSSAGVGVIFGRFKVTVEPGQVCRFRGLPDVRLLDRAGKARPTRTARDRLVSGASDYNKTVKVRAGHPAYFGVVYSTNRPSGRACQRAFGIDVKLPGSSLRDQVPVKIKGGQDDHHSFNPCDSAVAVTAIQR